ncbi:hypothetical protein LCGC14_2027420 [marine sediment metagenome]|uniref:Uncharacterized protein n=1 Tax=marine sediment metagenome TaxID=412755 RepID=A0A0F9FI77_9ZZZZ
MDKDTTYQGWTNYETWCVKLWLDNDQGTQELASEICKSPEYDSHYQSGLALREIFPEVYTSVQTALDSEGPASDLMRSALDATNWTEIAKNIKQCVPRDCSTTRANRFETARENYQRIKKLLEQFKDEETQPSSDHFTEWNLEETDPLPDVWEKGANNG